MANEAISQAPDAGAFNPLWRFPVAIPGNTAPASTSGGTLLQGLANLISTGVTTNQQLGSGPIPANAFLLWLFLRNLTNAPVNVSIGTTLGGSDVVPQNTVPAAGVGTGTLTVFLIAPNWFSATVPQNLYVTIGTVGAAGINAQMVYQVGP